MIVPEGRHSKFRIPKPWKSSTGHEPQSEDWNDSPKCGVLIHM